MTGRGLHGRDVARLMLAMAIGFDLLVAFLIVSAPHFMGPMFATTPGLASWVLPAGLAANMIGLSWMIRIVRSIEDAEAHPSFFRYDRF